MQKNLSSIASILIIILPILIITGPFLSDLSVVIIDLIFLFYLYKEKNFKYLNNNLFKFLILFNIYISVRSFFTDEIFFSLKSSLTYIRFSILIFAIKFFLERDKKLLNNFSKVFLITISILFIDSLFQYINGYNLLGFKINNPDKLNSLFGDEGVLGSYLIRFLPLFLVCFLTLNQNKHLFLLNIFIFGVFIFLAGSRSAIALYILFFLTFLFLFNNYRLQFISYVLALVIIIALIFVGSNFQSKKTFLQIDLEGISQVEVNLKNKFFYTVYYNFYDPIKTIFNKNKMVPAPFLKQEFKFREITMFSKVYDAHYRTAYKMFKENIFFGVGNKMYRKLCSHKKYYTNDFGCSTHPHNLHLQVLAENGLIGFIFILIIFSYTIIVLLREFLYRNFKKIIKIKDKNLILIIGIFLNFWPIVPFGNFYNNWLSILIYLPIGFLLYFRKKE